MARIRSIKPEIASDLKLASVSRDARYTFIMLISQSDDDGLIAGTHRQLLGSLFPHDDDVSTAALLEWVEELVVIGLLRWRATTEGAPVLEITNWTKHQRIDNKGRSQIVGLLAPLAGSLPPTIAENIQPLAETLREPPRLAESRGLEVGSRSKEVGSRKEDSADAAPAASGDAVDQLLAEFDFGKCAPSVAGLIRAARNPQSVIATLRLHLSGELGHELATPAELGLACQQYLANGKPFNAAYFAGFVRSAKRGMERTHNRRANASEERFVAREQLDRARDADEARASELELRAFADKSPERYEELYQRAEASVPKKLTMGRDIMVRSQLLRLIREEKAA